MDELYQIAARYHRDLCSFRAYGGFREPWLLLFLLAVVATALSLGRVVVDGVGRDGGPSLWSLPFGFFFASSVVTRLALARITARRDQRIRSQTTEQQRRCRDDGMAVQVYLLERAFRCDRSRFLALARSIRDAIEIEEAYNQRESFWASVVAFISLPKSASTLLALFAILLAIIALTSNSVLTFPDLIAMLVEAGHVIFSIAAFTMVVAFVLVVTVRCYVSELSSAWTFLWIAHMRDDARSLPAVRNLVRDLNRFHTWRAVGPEKAPAWKGRVKRRLRGRTPSSSRDPLPQDHSGSLDQGFIGSCLPISPSWRPRASRLVRGIYPGHRRRPKRIPALTSPLDQPPPQQTAPAPLSEYERADGGRRLGAGGGVHRAAQPRAVAADAGSAITVRSWSIWCFRRRRCSDRGAGGRCSDLMAARPAGARSVSAGGGIGSAVNRRRQSCAIESSALAHTHANRASATMGSESRRET